ncbi:hypothetical protein Golomagni_02381, partial [Golovinomyces magnicellulatus]
AFFHKRENLKFPHNKPTHIISSPPLRNQQHLTTASRCRPGLFKRRIKRGCGLKDGTKTEIKIKK